MRRFGAMAKPSFAVIEKVNLAEFQNPQQEPGMERRLLLVFALTFLVIVLFQPIIKKYFPQATPPLQHRKARARRRPFHPRPSINQVQPSATGSSGAQCGRDQTSSFRIGNRCRERSLPHHVYQPRSAGQVLDPKEIYRR